MSERGFGRQTKLANSDQPLVTDCAYSGMANKTEHQRVGIMAEFKPGDMDIRGQQKTFDGFLRMVTWGGIIAIVILIIMALADA